MKILVDEMPTKETECLFADLEIGLIEDDYYICNINKRGCHLESGCPFLAKGAVDRELVFETEGAEEIAKAVHGDGKALRWSGSVSE